VLANASVQLHAHYHHCGEAASEKSSSAAPLVRRRPYVGVTRSGALHRRASLAWAQPTAARVLAVISGRSSYRDTCGLESRSSTLLGSSSASLGSPLRRLPSHRRVPRTP